MRYYLIHSLPEKPQKQKKDTILTPVYPKPTQTLMGMVAVKTPSNAFRVQAAEAPLPIKYQVCLRRMGSHMMVMGTVITHLDLSDWLELHGWDLRSLEGPPELALPSERTELG